MVMVMLCCCKDKEEVPVSFKMEIMWVILKMIGAGCLIVLAAMALMVLVACFVAVFKALTKKN